MKVEIQTTHNRTVTIDGITKVKHYRCGINTSVASYKAADLRSVVITEDRKKTFISYLQPVTVSFSHFEGLLGPLHSAEILNDSGLVVSRAINGTLTLDKTSLVISNISGAEEIIQRVTHVAVTDRNTGEVVEMIAYPEPRVSSNMLDAARYIHPVIDSDRWRIEFAETPVFPTRGTEIDAELMAEKVRKLEQKLAINSFYGARPPKLCFAQVGSHIKLDDDPATYIVVAGKYAPAEHPGGSGLYGLARELHLVNMTTGELVKMPHLSTRVRIL